MRRILVNSIQRLKTCIKNIYKRLGKSALQREQEQGEKNYFSKIRIAHSFLVSLPDCLRPAFSAAEINSLQSVSKKPLIKSFPPGLRCEAYLLISRSKIFLLMLAS